MFQALSPSKKKIWICFDEMSQFKKKLPMGCCWGDLVVGIYIVINDQLPDGIWKFQQLLWTHERQGITDNQSKFCQ